MNQGRSFFEHYIQGPENQSTPPTAACTYVHHREAWGQANAIHSLQQWWLCMPSRGLRIDLPGSLPPPLEPQHSIWGPGDWFILPLKLAPTHTIREHDDKHASPTTITATVHACYSGPLGSIHPTYHHRYPHAPSEGQRPIPPATTGTSTYLLGTWEWTYPIWCHQLGTHPWSPRTSLHSLPPPLPPALPHMHHLTWTWGLASPLYQCHCWHPYMSLRAWSLAHCHSCHSQHHEHHPRAQEPTHLAAWSTTVTGSTQATCLEVQELAYSNLLPLMPAYIGQETKDQHTWPATITSAQTLANLASPSHQNAITASINMHSLNH